MLRYSLNPFSKDFKELSGDFDNIKEAVNFLIKDRKFQSMAHHFIVYLDGQLLDKDKWEKTSTEGNIFITIQPKGGSGRDMLRSGLIMAAVVAVSIAIPAAAPAALKMAIPLATSIGATLLFNALIPPSSLGGAEGYGSTGEYEDSQMFSLTNQSNTPMPYRKVPRVFGTHRMFPAVAAKPYMDLVREGDQIVQYLVCIYDFGVGPNILANIKIGDTSIDSFQDAKYEIVDQRRPNAYLNTPIGEWNNYQTEFRFYRNAVNVSDFNTPIVQGSEVIRTTPEPIGNSQDIIITFNTPRGLYSIDAQGNRRIMRINIRIEIFLNGAYRNLFSIPNLSVEHVGLNNVSISGTPINIINANNQVINWTIVAPENYDDLGGFRWGMRLKTGLPAIAMGFYVYTLRVEKTFAMSNLANSILYNGNTRLGTFLSNPLDLSNSYEYTIRSTIPITTPLSSVPLSEREIVFFTGRKRYIRDHDIHDKFRIVVSSIGYALKNLIYVTDSTNLVMEANQSGSQFSTVRFKAPPALSTQNFNVRFTKIAVPITGGIGTFDQIDDINLVSIASQSRSNIPPINTQLSHTFLEVRIKATDQLNGMLQNLNAEVTSVLDVYNTTHNRWEQQPTSNPAWVVTDILTGSMNRKAIVKDRLDLPSLIEFAEFCDEIPTFKDPTKAYIFKRYETNFVLDFDVTVRDIINNVLNACQASLNINNGKYGVLLDKKRDVPVQIFTPRNVSDFSSARKYYTPPHKLHVKFIDPDMDWQQNEVVVYQDGFDINNAETFEELQTFACTEFEQAWRYGRYMMAQAKLRQESITIEVDWEHLICTRGDFVLFVQDIMKVGGRPSRIRDTDGNIVTVDDEFVFDPELDYAYTFRAEDGEIKSGTLEILTTFTAELTGEIPSIGDLFVYGETEKVTMECIVKSIEPIDEYNAAIQLVERAPFLYEAESGEMIPEYNAELSTATSDDLYIPPAVVDLVKSDSGWRCSGNGYEYYINLSWGMPVNSVVDKYEVYANNMLIDVISSSNYEYIVPSRKIGTSIEFKILALSARGNKLPLVEATTLTVLHEPKTTPPSNVQALYLNVTGEVLQFEWPLVRDCDVDYYIIRYSPSLNAFWESSIPLLTSPRTTSMASTQARTGTYLIKAIDFAGNLSEIAARAVTTIPELFNLNIIETVDDFPELEGARDRVTLFGEALRLQSINVGGIEDNTYHQEGFYNYSKLVDLGDIYTCRIQTNLEAEGFSIDDLMENWITLDQVERMSNSGFADWDVELQMSTRDSYSVIEMWDTLESVNLIFQGREDAWTPWRKIGTIGDFTGRVFRFRIRLLSFKDSVTPLVFGGKIKIDMPDRIDSYRNITAPVGGFALTYNPKFKGPSPSPVVQITQDAAQSGDRYVLSDKSIEGFTIQFFDAEDNPVERQFDCMIRGYGRRSIRSL